MGKNHASQYANFGSLLKFSTKVWERTMLVNTPILEAYLAMSLYRILKREDEEVQMFLYGIAVYFSYNIVQHHASMLLEAQNEIVWSDERLQELSPYLSLLAGYDFTEEFVKQFHFILQHTSGRVDGVFYQMNNSIMHTTEPFSLYALMRLHYSILTSSDYLATAHYINGWKNII